MRGDVRHNSFARLKQILSSTVMSATYRRTRGDIDLLTELINARRQYFEEMAIQSHLPLFDSCFVFVELPCYRHREYRGQLFGEPDDRLPDQACHHSDRREPRP